MRPDEYIGFDGTSLAELVRSGEVTARALARGGHRAHRLAERIA